jgi:hypothetical protein
MEQRFEAEELDRETLEYLHTVAEREGDGLPGIFLTAKQAQLTAASLPMWAAICGPIIVFLTLFMTWGSLADPISVAMLQTAGFLLGGWLILAWIRSLAARGRPDYIGYFRYIDPLYIWTGVGRAVVVRSIEMLHGAVHEHNYDTNGNYTNTSVKISLADGKTTIHVRSTSRGERLQEYLNALAEQPPGVPAQRGYAALREVETEDEEAEFDSDVEVIDTIPHPQRVGSPGGWLPLLVIPIAGVVLFFVCRWFATWQRDGAYFEEVKNRGVPELRGYLLDRRNTRYREEVRQRLRNHLESTAQRVQQLGDPALAAGLADLIRGVAGEARPIITMCVVKQEKKADTPEMYLSAALQETMNRQIIKEISDRLGQHLSPQTADYAEVAEPPAMIEFVPRVSVPARGVARRELKLTWTVTLRAGPEAPRHTLTLSSTMEQTTEEPLPALRGAYVQLGKLFNERLTAQRQP